MKKKNLRFLLFFFMAIVLLFTSQISKMENDMQMPTCGLSYIDGEGEEALEALVMVEYRWEIESAEEDGVRYSIGTSPLATLGKENGENYRNSETGLLSQPMEIEDENDMVATVYAVVPAEKPYQYSIVKSWSMDEIREALELSETVTQEDIPYEVVPFLEEGTSIAFQRERGRLYRITSFWGEDGEYTTYEVCFE